MKLYKSTGLVHEAARGRAFVSPNSRQKSQRMASLIKNSRASCFSRIESRGRRPLLVPPLFASREASTYQTLPTTVNEMIYNAANAISSASEKTNRHVVTLINPVNEKARAFTSTEAMDYPDSNFAEV